MQIGLRQPLREGLARTQPAPVQGFATSTLYGTQRDGYSLEAPLLPKNFLDQFRFDLDKYLTPNGLEDKIEVRLHDGRTAYAYSEDEAKELKEMDKRNAFLDLVISSCSSTSYASAAKTIYGEDASIGGNLPPEIVGIIETAMQADSNLSQNGLNILGTVIKDSPLYAQKLREIEQAANQFKNHPALFLGRTKLEQAGISSDLFTNPGVNLHEVSIGNLKSLVSKLNEIYEEERQKART